MAVTPKPKKETATTDKNEIRYVGVRETLKYSLAAVGKSAGTCLFTGGYLSLFLTKVFGLPSGPCSVVLMLIGIWDAINDPIMGVFIDKTKTRYGKLRPYLMFAPIPFAIVVFFFFAGPSIIPATAKTWLKIAWVSIFYFLEEGIFTITDIPYGSMPGAMSPSEGDRMRVISARSIMNNLGTFPTYLLVFLMDFTDNGKWSLTLADDFLIEAIFCGILCASLFTLGGFSAKERIARTTREPSIIEGFKSVIHNKPMMLLIAQGLIGIFLPNQSTFQAYYFSEVAHNNTATILVALIPSIFGQLTLFFIPKLREKFESLQLLVGSKFVRAAASIIAFLVGLKFYKTNFTVIQIILTVFNLINFPVGSIETAAGADIDLDCLDYIEWKTGERTEGVTLAARSFISKVMGSVTSGFSTALLPLIGLSFKKLADGSSQTIKKPRTDLCLWALTTTVPWVMMCITLIPLIFYDLKGEKLKKIRYELKERRAAMVSDVSEVERKEAGENE